MKNPPLEKVCHTIRDTIDIITERFPDGGTFVESGTYIGNTAAFIVNQLVKNHKTFKLYTIDNFIYDNISEQQKTIDQVSCYDDYLKNIQYLEVDDLINTIVGDSITSIEKFADNSVYCVFIDDNHHYGHVKEQIYKWMPKIVPGGIIIGDDYEGGVKKAYDEIFSEKVQLTGRGGCIIYL